MTNNPNTKYTDLTQSKRLKKIGFKAEADGYWNIDGSIFKIGNKLDCRPLFYSNWTPSYRLDTLLLKLPEWVKEVFSLSHNWCDSDRERFIAWIWFIKWLKKKNLFYEDILNYEHYEAIDLKRTGSNSFLMEFKEEEDIYSRVIKACDTHKIPRVDVVCYGGEEAIAAAVDLICLLKEEGYE